LQKLIDVARTNAVTLAIGIQILEQRLAGQFHATLQQGRQASVTQRHIVLDATLATELKADGTALDLYMSIAQGRQPIGLVVAHVALVANADEGMVQQADYQGHDLFTVKARS